MSKWKSPTIIQETTDIEGNTIIKNSANAAQIAPANSEIMKINARDTGNFTLGDTVTVNGATESAAGLKTIPGTFGLNDQAISANNSATLTVMSPSSSSSSSNNLALPPGGSAIVVNPDLSLLEPITKNFTFHDEIIASSIKMKLGITATFEKGISTSITFYEKDNDPNSYQLAEDLIGKPFSITLTEQGNFETKLLSGENPSSEIGHDA